MSFTPTPPPPYTNMTGLVKVMDHHVDVDVANYDGVAKQGGLVVDLTTLNLYVGDANGNLVSLANAGGGGGGNGTNYSNANVVAYAESGFAGNIVPDADSAYSLGSAAYQWKDLWVNGATIYMNTIPLNLSANNDLQFNNKPLVTSDPATGVVNVPAMVVTGNVTAQNFMGNGALLTDINANFSNANIANYLPVYSGNIAGNSAVLTGSLTAAEANIAGNLISGNSQTGILTANSVTVSGNIVGANITGNIYGNIAAPGSNTQVLFNDGGFLGASAGLTFDKNSLVLTVANIATGANTLYMTGDSIRSANNTIIIDPLSDGTQLGDVVVLGNLSVAGNVTYVSSNTATVNNLVWQAANNANSQLAASGGGLAVGPANASYATFLYDPVSNAWRSNISIITAGGIQVNGALSNATSGAFTGNLIANNMSAIGNINASRFIGNGFLLTNLNGANIIGAVPLANAANTAATVTSNAQPNITSVGTLTALSVFGNIQGGNLSTNGIVSAAGNVFGQNFIGTGATLTGNVSASNFIGNFVGNVKSPGANTEIVFNDTGLLGTSAAFTYNKLTSTLTTNALSFGASNLQITQNLIKSSNANIVIDPMGDGGFAGNVVILGSLSVAGNVTYTNTGTTTSNNLVWAAAANANSTAAASGGGLTVGPNASPYATWLYDPTSPAWRSNINVIANGNVTGTYIMGNGAFLTGLPASYSNSNAASFMSAMGANAIFTTANVTGDYFFGNGAFLTGLPESYSNANVANYLPIYNGNILAANVSVADAKLEGNVLSTTGGNLFLDPLGDGSPLGDVYVQGNLSVLGNVSYTNVSFAETANLRWVAANSAANAVDASGGGLTVGPAGAPHASFTYYYAGSAWLSSLPVIAAGFASNGNVVFSGNTDLGNLSNIHISGGNLGQTIVTDGNGNLTWGNAGTSIASVPAVYFTAPITGNNQVFTDSTLSSYTSASQMTVFYNGTLLENTYYNLSGANLTVSVPMTVGSTIDVISTLVGGNIITVTGGYGDGNVIGLLESAMIGNAIPLSDGVFDLGSGIHHWGNLNALGRVNANSMALTGNATIAGNLTVGGTVTYANATSLVTANLMLGLGNNQTGAAVNGGGIVVGNTNEASWRYNQPNQMWDSNISISANGNVLASGNVVANNVIVAAGLTAATVSASGTVTGGNIVALGTVTAGGNISGANLAITSAITAATVQTVANVTGGNLVSAANISGGNLGVSGQVIAQGNITGNVFTGNGALLTHTGPRVRALWSAAIQGSTMTPPFGAVSGAIGGTAGYLDNFYGVRLTSSAAFQTGYATWNLSALDMTAPVVTFKASVCSYAGTGADSIWMCFGGSAPSTDNSTTNGGVLVYYWFYQGKLAYKVAGGPTAQVAMAAGPNTYTWNSQTIYNASYTSWYDFTLVVYNYGTKRYLDCQVNGSSLYMIDLTGWSPAGNYVTVGGFTGGSTSTQYVRSMLASW